MTILKIEAKREGYSPSQIRNTMTVGELKELLEGYEEDVPIYLSHDNGYTYGGIRERDFIEDEEDIEED